MKSLDGLDTIKQNKFLTFDDYIARIASHAQLAELEPFKEVIVKEKVFEATGEEKTAFRFTTDKNGQIIDVNELPANLVNSLQ